MVVTMTTVDAQTRSAGIDLTGRTAVVTGAASGIGRACALALAAAGARVRVVDVDAAGAAEVAQAVGGEARAADLALAAADGAGRGDALEELARDADIVVNNAGFQVVRPVEEFPPESFRRMLAVMVEAPFRLVRGALPGMYARGWGRVVNISSVHGLRASPYKAGYVTAKHALEGFSKVVAVEGGPRGVTSNCINPGYVRTPLVERQIAEQAAVHAIGAERVVGEVLLARSAVKRLIEPAEVAELVAFLAGPAGAVITGVPVMMDAGWTAH
jgi:3-hydroxybutyrate dehydrogenase